MVNNVVVEAYFSKKSSNYPVTWMSSPEEQEAGTFENTRGAEGSQNDSVIN